MQHINLNPKSTPKRKPLAFKNANKTLYSRSLLPMTTSAKEGLVIFSSLLKTFVLKLKLSKPTHTFTYSYTHSILIFHLSAASQGGWSESLYRECR